MLNALLGWNIILFCPPDIQPEFIKLSRNVIHPPKVSRQKHSPLQQLACPVVYLEFCLKSGGDAILGFKFRFRCMAWLRRNGVEWSTSTFWCMFFRHLVTIVSFSFSLGCGSFPPIHSVFIIAQDEDPAPPEFWSSILFSFSFCQDFISQPKWYFCKQLFFSERKLSRLSFYMFHLLLNLTRWLSLFWLNSETKSKCDLSSPITWCNAMD